MIREATEDDLDQIVLLGKKFFDYSVYSEHATYDECSVRELTSSLININEGLLLTVEYGEKLVGILGAVLFPLFFNKHHLVCQELFWFVDQEYRDKKIGMDLLKATEVWAKIQGAKTMMMVSLSNDESKNVKRLYTMNGYNPNEQYFLRGL